jgi:hypothetical protein
MEEKLRTLHGRTVEVETQLQIEARMKRSQEVLQLYWLMHNGTKSIVYIYISSTGSEQNIGCG